MAVMGCRWGCNGELHFAASAVCWQEYSGMLRSKVLLNFAHSGMDPSMDNRLLHSMEGGLIC